MIGFDVVIIGGGLSGSSTALNLSKKGYSVLIIEKEKSQDYKPCAGGMASSMQRFLPLNIEDCIESKIKNVEFRWKAFHLNSTFLIFDSMQSSIFKGRNLCIEDAIPPAHGL